MIVKGGDLIEGHQISYIVSIVSVSFMVLAWSEEFLFFLGAICLHGIDFLGIISNEFLQRAKIEK